MQSTPPPTSPSFKVRTAFCGLLIGLLTLAAGAVSAQSIPNAGPNPGIKWRTLEAGIAPARSGSLTMIMHSQGQFEAFWRQLYGNQRPPTLAVNWGKEFVIGLCPGTSAPGASAALQTIASVNPSQAVAYWGIRTPPFGGTSLGQRGGSSPWELDAVEYFGGNLTFRRVPESRRTGNFTIVGPGWSGPPLIINSWSNDSGFDLNFIPWGVIDGGWYSYGANPQCAVLTNQDQLAIWFRTVYGPAAPFPQDFQWQGQMLAAITLGRCESPNGIQIGRIQSDGHGGYQIFYAVTEPSPGLTPPSATILDQPASSSTPPPLLAPYLIVRLPRLNGPVSFVRVDPKTLNQPNTLNQSVGGTAAAGR